MRAVALADQAEDRDGWLEARRPGVTATEVAKLARGGAAVKGRLIREKLSGVESFRGNAYTRHGKNREPILQGWAEAKHGLRENTVLFAHPENRRHMATPDAVNARFEDDPSIGEIKTTNKPFDSGPPPLYRDQIQWQIYVLDASGCWFIWELHEGFEPVGMEPKSEWIPRDQGRIDELIVVADEFLAELDGQTPVDPEIDELGDVYLAWLDAEKQAAVGKKQTRAAIEDRLGEWSELKHAGLRANVTIKRQPVVEEEVEVVDFDLDTFRVTHPRLFKRFATVTKETRKSGGGATFRVTRPKLPEVEVQDGELIVHEGAGDGGE